jgi:mannosyltransferase
MLLFHDYFGVNDAVAVLVVLCAVVAAAPPGGFWRKREDGVVAATGRGPQPAWWRSGGVSLPSVAAPLLVLPASLLLLESLVAHPLYVDRYVLYGEAGAALLAGAGVYRIGRWLGDAARGSAGSAAKSRLLTVAPGVVVCLCALLLQLGPQHYIRTPGSRAYNYGGPSNYVGARARPGDGVLFFGTFFRKARLGYPSDFRDVSDFAMAKSPQQAGNFRGTDKPFAATRPLMLEYRRIWVIGKPPSPKLASAALAAESVVLEKDFSLVAERHFRGIDVTLWLRRSL